MVLEILPKLMNTMVVSVMSGKLYGSIMALEGYWYVFYYFIFTKSIIYTSNSGFHHMLLNLMIEYPELRAKADELIKNFINDPYKRHKKEVFSHTTKIINTKINILKINILTFCFRCLLWASSFPSSLLLSHTSGKILHSHISWKCLIAMSSGH
jgi:hypothetical protein